MNISSSISAQSKVTEKQIEQAQKEAQEIIKTYGSLAKALRVIKDLLAQETGKKLTKRFTDKVKLALPNEHVYIVYPYDGQMIISIGHNTPKVTITDQIVPNYSNYGQPPVRETMEDGLNHYINSYDITVQNAERNLLVLPTFAAEYNAAINLVKDVMRKVPTLESCDLKYKLALMYFQGE